jgi:hypothetical protein
MLVLFIKRLFPQTFYTIYGLGMVDSLELLNKELKELV